MRKTTIRRLEALEKEERSREQKELSPLRTARVFIWQIVLGYYLGGLEPDEYPGDALARALNYPSGPVFCHALIKKDLSEVGKRFNDAYRRLFAKVGLDFDSTAQSVLFDAFVTMVNQLPDQWLKWLKSNLQEDCPSAEIGAGSNIPRQLSGDNFFSEFAREATCCDQDSS